jgi:hypothetical protein
VQYEKAKKPKEQSGDDDDDDDTIVQGIRGGGEATHEE